MGKSTTPKYRIIVDGNQMAWDCKSYGKPTDKNLETFVYSLGKSYELGGVNEHISISLGHIPYPINARIETNNRTPHTVATWKAGVFQIW